MSVLNSDVRLRAVAMLALVICRFLGKFLTELPSLAAASLLVKPTEPLRSLAGGSFSAPAPWSSAATSAMIFSVQQLRGPVDSSLLLCDMRAMPNLIYRTR